MHNILGNLCNNSIENIKKYFQQEGQGGLFTEKFSEEIVGHLKYNCIFRLKMAAKAPRRKGGRPSQENFKSIATCSRLGNHHIKSETRTISKGDTDALSREDKVNSDMIH